MSRLFFSSNIEQGSVRAGLLTWREMLELARIKGGCVIQMLVPPELSKMQLAEADMAKDKGVLVVKLDCRSVKGFTTEAQLEAMPGWDRIISMIQQPKTQRTIPRTREELQQALAAKDVELEQASAALTSKVCLLYIGSNLLRLD